MDEAALIDALSRYDRRRRLFPPGAACACGASNPLVLVAGRRKTTCYACDAVRRGLSGIEAHHVGGEPSPIVVPVPANLHKTLTFLQDVTWRPFYPPASPEAVLVDLVFLLVALLFA